MEVAAEVGHGPETQLMKIADASATWKEKKESFTEVAFAGNGFHVWCTIAAREPLNAWQS